VRRALLVVLALGVAACVESDPSTVEAPATTTNATVGQGAPVTTAPSTRRTIIVGGTDAVREPPTTGGSAPSTPAPASRRSAGEPGSMADVLLRPSGASQLVIQVLTEAGAEPRRSTLDRVVEVLRQASGKPVRTIGGSVAGRSTWSASDLRDAADAQAAPIADGTAVLRLLFVHGRSEQGDGVLGITTSGDLAAVFTDRVDAAASGLVSASTIERAVTVHELGHVLGLVDLFLHTGRADPEHPGHSTNTRSVMYWAVESTLIGDLLSGGPPEDFDAADLADLAAIRRG
jgi:hypothetical protein